MLIIDVTTSEQSRKNESLNTSLFENEEAPLHWFSVADCGIVFGVTIIAFLSIILAIIVSGYVQSKPLEFLRLVDLIYADIARFDIKN
jgi:hypothetical protein